MCRLAPCTHTHGSLDGHGARGTGRRPQGYSKTFFAILTVNNLSLEDLELPEFAPSFEVPPLVEQYTSLVVPQVKRVLDTVAAGIHENDTTCVSQNAQKRLGTTAPDDVCSVVRTTTRLSVLVAPALHNPLGSQQPLMCDPVAASMRCSSTSTWRSPSKARGNCSDSCCPNS